MCKCCNLNQRLDPSPNVCLELCALWYITVEIQYAIFFKRINTITCHVLVGTINLNPDVKIGATNPGACLLKKIRAEKMKFKNQAAGRTLSKGTFTKWSGYQKLGEVFTNLDWQHACLPGICKQLKFTLNQWGNWITKLLRNNTGSWEVWHILQNLVR